MTHSLCVLLMLCSTTVMTVTAYDWFFLENASGFVLDISRGKKGGRLIIDWKHGGDNQLWRFSWGRLISKTGLVADIYKGNRDRGTAVVGWTRGGGDNQRWTFRNNYIYSRLNGQVMDVTGGHETDGQEVIMWPWHGGSNQRWVPILYRPAPPIQIPDEDWFYLETSQGSVLDIPGGQIGRKLIVYKKHGADNQLWTWGPGGRLFSKTGLVCAVQRSDKSPGTHVIAWTPQSGLNQKWKLEGNKIVSQLTGLVMDVEGGFRERWNSNPDLEVVMFPRHGKANQRWYVTPASWRSYIVTRMDGARVLGIGRSKVKRVQGSGGFQLEIQDIRSSRRASQLWHFDKRGRIVSESGSAVDFEPFKVVCAGRLTSYCSRVWLGEGRPAEAVDYDVHKARKDKDIGKHWIYEEGLIKSSVNGLVLDVKGGRAQSGAQVQMWNVTRRPQQLWTLIPEKMIDNYKLMLENKNPSTEAFIYKEKVEDFFWSVSGFPSLEEYERTAKQSIVTINGAAEQLDKVAKDTAISDILGSSISIAGGAMALAGLLLAPFTAGASLGMTVGSVAAGVSGTVTSATSDLIEQAWEDSEYAEVRHEFTMVRSATLRMHNFMNEYIKKLKAAHEYSGTAEGRQFLVDAARVNSAWEDALRLGKPLESVAWKLYKAKGSVVKNYKVAKFLRDVWKGAIYIDPSIKHAVMTRSAYLNVASGNVVTKVLGKVKGWENAMKAGGKVARAISGISAVASVAFGVKGVVAGTYKIEFGSDLADECREMAKHLDEASKLLVDAYRELKQ